MTKKQEVYNQMQVSQGNEIHFYGLVENIVEGNEDVISKAYRTMERSGFNTAKEIRQYEAMNANQPVRTFNIKDLQTV